MTDVIVGRPVRTCGQALSPADFDDIAPCESVKWGDAGALVVSFTGDLSADQRLAVQIRCITSDSGEEAVLLQAALAYRKNQEFLSMTAPTTSQVVAQVTALTRQVQGLIRYAVRDCEEA